MRIGYSLFALTLAVSGALSLNSGNGKRGREPEDGELSNLDSSNRNVRPRPNWRLFNPATQSLGASYCNANDASVAWESFRADPESFLDARGVRQLAEKAAIFFPLIEDFFRTALFNFQLKELPRQAGFSPQWVWLKDTATQQRYGYPRTVNLGTASVRPAEMSHDTVSQGEPLEHPASIPMTRMQTRILSSVDQYRIQRRPLDGTTYSLTAPASALVDAIRNPEETETILALMKYALSGNFFEGLMELIYGTRPMTSSCYMPFMRVLSEGSGTRDALYRHVHTFLMDLGNTVAILLAHDGRLDAFRQMRDLIPEGEFIPLGFGFAMAAEKKRDDMVRYFTNEIRALDFTGTLEDEEEGLVAPPSLDEADITDKVSDYVFELIAECSGIYQWFRAARLARKNLNYDAEDNNCREIFTSTTPVYLNAQGKLILDSYVRDQPLRPTPSPSGRP
ncbi:hypothetical protein IWQ60_010788 [Tieghemiomyces parasiticus]|uniref:Uncharacterized protein n=1 Tax=Tieghemiomyces parasiticus TaxID=78921 RepID=A0A9W7ZKV0_9FUNG|nr:hypothetical protein IWQ60_010788 [Tieghemiomyces parasiticus]